ncbi:MAG: hypothetical protein ACJAS1_000515 [Oleiphilaceae bacterium]|jgi:hypothetical protein
MNKIVKCCAIPTLAGGDWSSTCTCQEERLSKAINIKCKLC